jgi:uncharacterized protein
LTAGVIGETQPQAPKLPRIDVHVHLAGVGTQGSGCWMSPAFRRRPTFLGLRLLHRISTRQLETTVDQDWAAFVAGLVWESDLDAAMVLGFDGVYDQNGAFDPARSQLVVPPDWVFEVCERYTGLLPAPSINPDRRDALVLLEEAIERGAVAIKWLPIVQGFDPAGDRALPFLKRLAEAGIPLLIHAGTGEVTFKTVDDEVGDLARIIPALELGVRLICAHSAAPIQLSGEASQLPLLRDLLGRYSNLWVDNSGLANPSRFRYLPEFAEDPLISERTLHGSDFPVITNAFYYLNRLGVGAVRQIESERNSLQRDLLIKRAVGFPEAAFTRATGVLANLERWLTHVTD